MKFRKKINNMTSVVCIFKIIVYRTKRDTDLLNELVDLFVQFLGEHFHRLLLTLFDLDEDILDLPRPPYLVTGETHHALVSQHPFHPAAANQGPLKCYVRLFSWNLDPQPPPRNANNIEPYTFVTLFPGKFDTRPPPSALRNT